MRDNTVIIYYFFDYSNKTTLHTSTFLRCILHQVIRPEILLPDLQRRLESIFTAQIDQAEPDTSELIELFVLFYRKFKNAFVLIDGLDQADKDVQRNVKFFLKKVQKLDYARILVASHADVDMLKVLGRSPTLQIKAEDLTGDIEIFVQGKVDDHKQEELSEWSPSLINKVKLTLISGAEEM